LQLDEAKGIIFSVFSNKKDLSNLSIQKAFDDVTLG
jgi:hypothetical protein